MWHALLHFYSDLILFTAGTAVLLFWVVAFVLAFIEGKDLITEHYFNKDEEDEDA